MKKFFDIFQNVYPFLLLIFILFILFFPVIFKGYVFIDGDNFHLNIPMKYLLVDSLRSGNFPLWNPYILGGIPYAADLNLGTFNPLNFLYFLFPIPRALTLHAIIDLFLIGCFQYIYLRKNVSKSVALIGGIIFMLSGTVFIFISNVAILHTIVFIPLLFLSVQFFLETKQKKYFLLLVSSQVLQIISGHPQITYYTIFFILLFFLFYQMYSFKKKIVFIGLYLFFSLTISSFQLIPFFEYVLQANRPIHSFSYATTGSLTISHIITTFFPTFFGTKIHGNWWGSQVMLFGYIGVGGLVLLIQGLFSAKFAYKKFFVFSLVLSTLLAFGKWGLVYYLFYFLLPGWSALRSPGNIFVMSTFFATIVASYGLEQFVNKGKKSIKILPFTLISLFFLIVSITVFVITTYVITWTKVFLFLQYMHFPLVHKILFYSITKIQSIFYGITLNVIIFFLFLSLTFLLVVIKNKKMFLFCTGVLITINLMYFDSTYLQLAPLSFYSQQHISIPASVLQGEYRIFAMPITIPQNKKYMPGPDYFYTEAKYNLMNITDNHAVPLQAISITGYSSLVLRNYSQMTDSKNVTGITPQVLTKQKLSELGVKYIYSINSDGKLSREENSNAIKRSFLLHRAVCNTVRIMSNLPNSVTINAYSSQDNDLILLDNFYSGWSVTVNNKQRPIQMYKNTFRKVHIPKGANIVIFTYNPLSWKIGVIISLIGIVGLFVLLSIKKQYV